MSIEKIQKSLNNTIEEFKKHYEESIHNAYVAIHDLPQEEKEKYQKILNEVKTANKKQDVDSLKNILNNLKNKV